MTPDYFAIGVYYTLLKMNHPIKTSTRQLAYDLKLGRQRVRTVLKNLVNMGYITHISTHSGSEIILKDHKPTKAATHKLTHLATRVKTEQYSPDFLKFWDLYPRKKSKGAAWKAWLKIKPNSEVVALIMSAAARHKEEWEKRGTEMQYIPYPSSWLNARRWEDEDEIDPLKAWAMGDKHGKPIQAPNDTEDPDQYQSRHPNRELSLIL